MIADIKNENKITQVIGNNVFRIRVYAARQCWIANWNGDPGRTLVRENAKVFNSQETAEKALELLSKKWPSTHMWIERD